MNYLIKNTFICIIVKFIFSASLRAQPKCSDFAEKLLTKEKLFVQLK